MIKKDYNYLYDKYANHIERSVFMFFSQSIKDNPLKKKLESGELVIGTWINAFRDPLIAKLTATAGFDYIFIDQEHSGISNSDLVNICLIARECGVAPILRPVEINDFTRNGRALDNGAVGLIVPHVESREGLDRIIKSTRYFEGTRGYVSRSINTAFSKNDISMLRNSEENTIIVVQFEDTNSIAHADSILLTKGIDIVVVGRGDLAISMGLPGQTSHPRVIAEVEKVILAANKAGVPSGLLVQTVEDAKFWIKKGIRCITYGSEVSLLLSAYEHAIKALKNK